MGKKGVAVSYLFHDDNKKFLVLMMWIYMILISDVPLQCTVIYHLNKNNKAKVKIRQHRAKQQVSHSVSVTN